MKGIRSSSTGSTGAPAHEQLEAQLSTASPNKATVERLRWLPPTLLLVDEADVLRDGGEAYAARLRVGGPSASPRGSDR
jgi:acetyl esterase/lipase